MKDDLMIEKFKKTCRYLSYVELLLILPSTVIGYISIYAFALLVIVTVGITSSAVGRNICAIIAGIKKYNIVGVGVLTPLFYENSLNCLSPLFKFCSPLPAPSMLPPTPTPTPTAHSVVLFLWLNG